MITRTAFVLACIAGLLTGILFPQSIPEVERAKSGVVMIHSEWPAENSQKTHVFGAGIITAVKDDEIYVATADHVVRSNGEYSKAITVQFEGRRGDWFEARRLDLPRDPALDLAVLRAALPPKVNAGRLTGLGAAPASALSRGADVYPVGYKSERPWVTPVVPDKIDEVGGVLVLFVSQFVAPGISGGALLDACGRVVGMVTETENASEARAIPIEVVLAALKRWSVPTSLSLDRAACSSATTKQTPTPASPPAVGDGLRGGDGRNPRALRGADRSMGTNVSLSGSWNIIQTSPENTVLNGVLELSQRGTSFTGTANWPTIRLQGNVTAGTIDGDHVQFLMTFPDGLQGVYEGTLVSPNRINGSTRGGGAEARWSATRR
jgi:trypsin-like peptidase